MKLEARSKKLLAVTKSKAKMFEFDIGVDDHIQLQQDPNELLISTIAVLGDLAAMEARQESVSSVRYEELRSELSSVGQFFDALVQSHLADDVSIYLRLIGSAAYYLANMPGSSSVLSNSLLNMVAQI
jgi:POLQ-like helicase